MGFELKIIVAGAYRDDEDASPGFLATLKKYGQSYNEIASFDMSGVDQRLSNLYHQAVRDAEKRKSETGIFNVLRSGYFRGGNEMRNHMDMYGSIIARIPLEDFIAALRLSTKESMSDYGGLGYRRYTIALGLLEDIQERFGSQYENRLYILTWGH